MTHAEIKQSRDDFKKRLSLRKEELRVIARKVYDDYEESLKLDKAHWADVNGFKRQYVTIGLKNDKGLYQVVPFAMLLLDKDYKLNFLIATTVDDSLEGDGYQHLVSISLYKEAGLIYVDVGAGEKSLVISDPEADAAFYDVSKAIKQVIIKAFDEPRLN